MAASAPQRLVSMISRLGGPDISPEEIEWATDLPAGKNLLEWFTNQFPNDLSVGGGWSETDWVAWKDITLEREEFSSLKHAEAFALVHSLAPSTSRHSTVSTYTLPSEIEARIQKMEAESQLLEDEIYFLKHRLQRTKTVTQNGFVTTKNLESTLETTHNNITQKQENLGEFSNEADAAVSLSVDVALRIITTLNAKSKPYSQTPQLRSNESNLHNSLIRLADLRSRIINETGSMGLVDEISASLPRPEEVSREMARLHHAFSGHNYVSKPGEAHKDSLTKAAQEAAYGEELIEIYKHLEAGGAVEDLLDNRDYVEADFDVRHELSRAWACDQTAIMTAREEVLQKAIYAFQTHLIPPLSKLYSYISSSDGHICEAEGLIGALIEELGKLADDIRKGKKYSESSAKSDTHSARLDTQLTDLLKQLEGLRSVDAAPLVLLDRTDTIHELLSSALRAKDVKHRQDDWTADLPNYLSYLSGTHSELLTTIYCHSPVNTSIPFGPPQSVVAAEADAGDRVDILRKDIMRLQKEPGMSGKAQRKASTFLQKWGSPL